MTQIETGLGNTTGADNNPPSDLHGLILHVQRLSTEDGPGIRTTVFFKGCPLRCDWCHNPEGISPHPQVQWLENRCIGCESCVRTCPNQALVMTTAGIQISRGRCAGCGQCAEACPANAMELLGTRVGLDGLVGELVKDRVYFQKSGGGVTVSGGEPMLQPRFVAALFQRLQQEGISTALDTCGLCSPQSLEQVLSSTDILLFDIKEIDPDKHATFTGQHNRTILANLLHIRDRLAAKTLWIRTPLIPGITATPENLKGIGAFLAAHLPGRVQRWELCAFNNLCRDKYRRLGLGWPFADTPLLSGEALRELERYAKTSGVDPDIVVATGATQEN